MKASLGTYSQSGNSKNRKQHLLDLRPQLLTVEQSLKYQEGSLASNLAVKRKHSENEMALVSHPELDLRNHNKSFTIVGT